MDLSTILGLVLGFGALIMGFVIEGGNISSLFLISPAIIVFGGTTAAVMISNTLSDVMKIPKLFIEASTLHSSSTDKLIDTFVSLSQVAKKEGILSLENIINAPDSGLDPLIVKGLGLVIDGTDKDIIKDIMLTQVYNEEDARLHEASMFETAGGYGPTMGIIGTVMGLIHVLGNLSSPEELSKSIASSFLATLYGVGFANLVFLPIAGKLKMKISKKTVERQLIIEGVLAIRDGESSSIFKEKLYAYVSETEKKGKGKSNDVDNDVAIGG